MPNEKPTTFYRYFDIDGALSTLKSKTLRWSHHSTFNDPFDCNINICRTPDPTKISDEELIEVIKTYPEIKSALENLKENEIPKPLLEGMRKIFIESASVLPRLSSELHDGIQMVLNDFHILCLSKELENILMWGHYTKGHKGAVIEFIAQNDNYFCAAQEVTYQENFPKLFNNFYEMSLMVPKGLTKETKDKIYKASALTKSTHWEYEKEWRIMYPFPKNNQTAFQTMPFNSSDLYAVYLGCKMDSDKFNEITETLKKSFPKTRIFKANLNPERYSLDFTPI